MGGYCLVCQRVFLVSLPALIKERGGDCRYIGMKPLACPGCQGRRTTFQIIAPSKGGGAAIRGWFAALPSRA
jgi:hypothetical protein